MWIFKIIKIKCFNPPRILDEHWCIYSCLQIPPRENWLQYVRRVYSTAINFPCMSTLVLSITLFHLKYFRNIIKIWIFGLEHVEISSITSAPSDRGNKIFKILVISSYTCFPVYKIKNTSDVNKSPINLRASVNSELGTFEWDILNPDRLINLEIINKRRTSII